MLEQMLFSSDSFRKVLAKIHSLYNVTVTFMDTILLVTLVTLEHNMLQGKFVTFWLGLANRLHLVWVGNQNYIVRVRSWLGLKDIAFTMRLSPSW